jgi:glycosyltransferase involved in cell wall biosynthesis
MKNISVIIPAYKPDEALLKTIDDIINAGFEDLIVIDDGGGEAFAPIFDKVRTIPECTVLVHEVNRGKGAALKTAFAFFVENRKDHLGAVTVDADGQHLIKDIIATCDLMAETNHIVLGCRDFSGKDVPARSKFGNNCTIALVRLFFGMKISDTQTGLRAFPKDVIPELIGIDGDRYEYETHMLFYMSKHEIPFEEVKIQTVYIEENSSSHFRPIRDSLRIYSLIIKYLLSSVGSTLLDVLVYYILKALTSSTFLAGFVARAISSMFNYTVNAKAVFGEAINKRTLLRYYLLVVIQICASVVSVFLIEKVFSIESAFLSTVIKAIVDAILFFFSFRIQHKWVFGEKKNKKA